MVYGSSRSLLQWDHKEKQRQQDSLTMLPLSKLSETVISIIISFWFVQCCFFFLLSAAKAFPFCFQRTINAVKLNIFLWITVDINTVFSLVLNSWCFH